jgi:hypothetical protein
LQENEKIQYKSTPEDVKNEISPESTWLKYPDELAKTRNTYLKVPEGRTVNNLRLKPEALGCAKQIPRRGFPILYNSS